MEESHELQVAADRGEALRAVDEAAEAWGADWRADGASGGRTPGGGDLLLPFLAGLRRGVLRGRVQLYPGAAPDGAPSSAASPVSTRLVLSVGERHEHLHVAAVVILLLSAFGAAFTVIWPFYPGLLPLAPLGALLALGGWFLVVSRLRSSGPEEFLDLVRRLAEGEAVEGGDGAGGGAARSGGGEE